MVWCLTPSEKERTFRYNPIIITHRQNLPDDCVIIFIPIVVPPPQPSSTVLASTSRDYTREPFVYRFVLFSRNRYHPRIERRITRTDSLVVIYRSCDYFVITPTLAHTLTKKNSFHLNVFVLPTTSEYSKDANGISLNWTNYDNPIKRVFRNVPENELSFPLVLGSWYLRNYPSWMPSLLLVYFPARRRLPSARSGHNLHQLGNDVGSESDRINTVDCQRVG